MKQLKKYVAYYRVSTNKQSLGLDAQKTMITKYINGNAKIIAEFTEKESGKNNNRIELEKAINKAKEGKATLIIAKLDRLSRNVSFIFQLKESGVDFICADMPEMNTLNLGIFASMAQHEREILSERTKAALAEKKKQGIKLGKPENLTDASRKKAVAAIKENARNNENNKRALALIISLHEQGLSYEKISRKLNESGYKTRRGNKFSRNSVKQLLDRV